MKILSVLFVSVFVVSGCGRGHRVPWDTLSPQERELVLAVAAAEDARGAVPPELCVALADKGLLASDEFCEEEPTPDE